MKEYMIDLDTQIKTTDFTQTSTLSYEKQSSEIITDEGFIDLLRELRKLELV